MRRGGGARPSLLPPPLCAAPGLLWWSALRARAARPGGVRGLPRRRARPPSSGGRAAAALLRAVGRPLSARLRAPSASLPVALARCARPLFPCALGSLRSRCGAPSRGPFSAGAPLRGGRGRGSAALLRSAAPPQQGRSVAAALRVGGFSHLPPRPLARWAEGGREVVTACGRGRGPLTSARVHLPGRLLPRRQSDALGIQGAWVSARRHVPA